MAPANKSSKSSKAKSKPVKKGGASVSKAVKKNNAKAAAKPAGKSKSSKLAKPAPKKSTVKSAAKKPSAVKATKAKSAAPAKKKPIPAKKIVAVVKGKKPQAKAIKGAAAKAPPKNGKVPAVVVKPVKAEKLAKPEKAPKPEKVPKPPKVPRAKSTKLPPAKGPMEKAQRSLAATAARAAAKDKVPPTKALAAWCSLGPPSLRKDGAGYVAT